MVSNGTDNMVMPVAPMYGDNSYARGRDAMGRYVSRDDSRHDLIEHLRTMMDNARTPEERESYRNVIDHMSRN